MINIHHCGYSRFVAAFDNILTLLLRFFPTPLTIIDGYILVSLQASFLRSGFSPSRLESSMSVMKIEGNEQMCINQSSSVIALKFGDFTVLVLVRSFQIKPSLTVGSCCRWLYANFPSLKLSALALQTLCAIMVTISLIYIRDHDPDGWWNLFIEWGWWRSNNTASDQISFLFIEVNSL